LCPHNNRRDIATENLAYEERDCTFIDILEIISDGIVNKAPIKSEKLFLSFWDMNCL
jgi:hypothetical protein